METLKRPAPETAQPHLTGENDHRAVPTRTDLPFLHLATPHVVPQSDPAAALLKFGGRLNPGIGPYEYLPN
jgi:hypothetical protein